MPPKDDNPLGKFGHLFKQRVWPTRVAPGPREDEIRLHREKRAAEVRDMRQFVGTEAYKDYVARLERAIQENQPDPRGGSDVAACFTFRRQGLEEALLILRTMVKIAEEKIDA